MINKARDETAKFCSKECYDKYQDKKIALKCYNCGKKIFRKPSLIKEMNFCCHKCFEETYNKISYYKDILRKNGIKNMQNQVTRETKPEIMVKKYLIENEIKFYQQFPLYNRYVVDFYLPLIDTVIEVQGDYWHGNPKTYGDDKRPLSDRQKKQIHKDKERFKNLRNNGHIVYPVWETDIYKDINSALFFLDK